MKHNIKQIKKKQKPSSSKIKSARLQIAIKQNFRCLCCGKYISQEKMTSTNFAHWYNKSWMTDYERLTNQSLVCEELHIWEHNRPSNLEKNPCVQILINKYDDSYTELLKEKDFIKRQTVK